MEFFNN